MLAGLIRRLLREPRARAPQPCCLSMEARSEEEVRRAAFRLAPHDRAEAEVIETLIRELVSLNTPALFLNVVRPDCPLHIVLQPSAGRSVRFRGSSYFVDAGADAAAGVEALVSAPFARVPTLYPTAPDHAVYVVSIEHQDTAVYQGEFPSWLTHITLFANGRVVTRAERLLHERGAQVWAA